MYQIQCLFFSRHFFTTSCSSLSRWCNNEYCVFDAKYKNMSYQNGFIDVDRTDFFQIQLSAVWSLIVACVWLSIKYVFNEKWQGDRSNTEVLNIPNTYTCMNYQKVCYGIIQRNNTSQMTNMYTFSPIFSE